MSEYRYRMEVQDATNKWWVFDADKSPPVSCVAQGNAPDEATARRCADAVVAVLEGRDVLGELEGVKLGHDAVYRALAGVALDFCAERDALRAELEALRSTLRPLLAMFARDVHDIPEGEGDYNEHGDIFGMTVAMGMDQLDGLAGVARALLTPEVPREQG